MEKTDIMEEQSRAERIQKARESCRSNYGQRAHEKKIQRNEQQEGNGLNYIRFFIIRAVFAAAIFGGIVLIDTCNLKYKELDSTAIKQAVLSNSAAEKTKEFLDSLPKEKIQDFLNGRKD